MIVWESVLALQQQVWSQGMSSVCPRSHPGTVVQGKRVVMVRVANRMGFWGHMQVVIDFSHIYVGTQVGTQQ